MMNRYEVLHSKLKQFKKCAFIPFLTLGDHGVEGTLAFVRACIKNGADALELGIPFTDPLADGPVIQRSNLRALQSQVNTDVCFQILERIRQEFSEIPIGLLTYCNVIFAFGSQAFYQRCKEVGIDSVLVADLPLRESEIFKNMAQDNHICRIFIAPSNIPDTELTLLSHQCSGYLYVVSRSGVTGVSQNLKMPEQSFKKKLSENIKLPHYLGFGISSPEHVAAAVNIGFDGVIVGSAICQIIENHKDNLTEISLQLGKFVNNMNSATYRCD